MRCRNRIDCGKKQQRKRKKKQLEKELNNNKKVGPEEEANPRPCQQDYKVNLIEYKTSLVR